MKKQLERRETWTLIVSVIAYLSGVACGLHPSIEVPIEALTAVLASSIGGIGIGSVAQVKRAQQRGKEAAQTLLAASDTAPAPQTPTAPRPQATQPIQSVAPSLLHVGAEDGDEGQI